MGVVRLDDPWRVLFQETLEPPGGVEIYLVSGCQGNQVCPFQHPPEQFTLRLRDEYCPVIETSQSKHRVHDLALAAAPGLGRVDMEGEQLRIPGPESRASSHPDPGPGFLDSRLRTRRSGLGTAGPG